MKKFMYVVLFLFVLLVGAALMSDPEVALQGIQNDVAIDFEEQYQMARRSGSEIDICMRAGLVAEGYLQARNEEKYNQWRNVQRRDCQAAGIPY
jgi:hypothetical protein